MALYKWGSQGSCGGQRPTIRVSHSDVQISAFKEMLDFVHHVIQRHQTDTIDSALYRLETVLLSAPGEGFLAPFENVRS